MLTECDFKKFAMCIAAYSTLIMPRSFDSVRTLFIFLLDELIADLPCLLCWLSMCRIMILQRMSARDTFEERV